MKSNNEAIKLRWELQQTGMDDVLDAGIKVVGDRHPVISEALFNAREELGRLGPRMTEAMRYEYDLTPDSVVLDCGGYKGEWAEEIHRRYGCTVHVLEPVKEFFDRIVARFGPDHPKIHVHQFGVGEFSGSAEFGIQNDSTGQFSGSAEREIVMLHSIGATIRALNLGTISLMKLNTEGAEFSVIEALLNTGLIDRVDAIQVQFHDCAPDSKRRYEVIQERLAETHFLTLYTGWQWQSWSAT